MPKYRTQLRKVQHTVSETTGVLLKSIQKIIADGGKYKEKGTSFSTPGKCHKVPKPRPITEVIRRTMHNFYLQESTVPAIPELLVKLRD